MSLLLLCFFLCFCLLSMAFSCPQTQQQQLLSFQLSLPPSNYSSWVWLPSTDCCSWPGVSCGLPPNSSSLRVTSLSLPSLGIKAPIPPSLGNLTFLLSLNLSNNQLYGSIPPEAASLSHLRILDLSNNNLSGALSVLQSLPSLQSVDISNNDFSGSLPAYGNFTNLEEFHAGMNGLSSILIADVCQHATKLRALNLSFNNFTGRLEYGFGLCANLQELDLGFNSFVGSIPDDLYNATSLSILRLSSNNFSGSLKDGIGDLTNLTQLSICDNHLSGVLPKSLSRNSKLVALSLGTNSLTGSIDVDFANMTFLDELDLNTNLFTGSIPSSLVSCTRLRVLNLAVNELTGMIPTGLNFLKHLTTVSLSTNQLNGSLFSVQKAENLVSLVLTKNSFIEPLPSTFNGFFNLQVLALGFLNLKGNIPAWLQNCTKLQILDLSWNQLEGKLPHWLGGFQHLIYLELSNNSFSGMIPPQLFTLTSMMHKDSNMTGLQPDMDTLSVKRQTDSPDRMYNKPKAFPPSIYLSHNQLIGGIPSEIGLLQVLVDLDLSHNRLTGRIPASLANVTSLELLDLSYNQLSGSIPETLNRLTFLASFNVSYNNLSGIIPVGNQFSTFSNTSYEADPGLCGYPLSLRCGNDSMRNVDSIAYSFRKKMKIALLVSVCVGFGIAALLVTGFFFVLSGRSAIHQDSSREISTSESLSGAYNVSLEFFHNRQKLTVGELFKATNNFDTANIVGCGGFGLVYRADLGDGSRLAIKKLTGDCGQMEREFRAELDALSKAKHRNLVPLEGYFHIGNDKLLIYSYMENGSLDYWLHERSDGPARLDWQTRLKIAQGSATGLAYLHQICNPHIVHRDIKSSNILLDEQFEAHLADFGPARLMMSTQTHVTTELVGTFGYIPPEYGDALNATPRGDVYSFGVVLLELLTGKRPVDVCKPRKSADLVAWVQQMRQINKSDQVFDNLLQNKSCEEQMRRVLDVACLCISRDPLNMPVHQPRSSEKAGDKGYCFVAG